MIYIPFYFVLCCDLYLFFVCNFVFLFAVRDLFGEVREITSTPLVSISFDCLTLHMGRFGGLFSLALKYFSTELLMVFWCSIHFSLFRRSFSAYLAFSSCSFLSSHFLMSSLHFTNRSFLLARLFLIFASSHLRYSLIKILSISCRARLDLRR